MKLNTFIDIFGQYLGIDSETAQLIYNEIDSDLLDDIMGKTPLNNLSDVFTVINAHEADDFRNWEDYDDFITSPNVLAVDLPNGKILIVEKIPGFIFSIGCE